LNLTRDILISKFAFKWVNLYRYAAVANLPWFDAVLVDIGDSQDLMQSLSTFSARLAKQRAILAAANPRSLVLMDEVGTGTSPAEGSAIGGALLEQLAGVGGGFGGAAGLTLATTHHGGGCTS
jgi:DNA mismatch repair protein MutS2